MHLARPTVIGLTVLLLAGCASGPPGQEAATSPAPPASSAAGAPASPTAAATAATAPVPPGKKRLTSSDGSFTMLVAVGATVKPVQAPDYPGAETNVMEADDIDAPKGVRTLTYQSWPEDPKPPTAAEEQKSCKMSVIGGEGYWKSTPTTVAGAPASICEYDYTRHNRRRTHLLYKIHRGRDVYFVNFDGPGRTLAQIRDGAAKAMATWTWERPQQD